METLIRFWSHNQTAFVVAAVVMLILVLVFVRAGLRKNGKKLDSDVVEDLAKGSREAAAERELKAGRLGSAYDLYVRARQPMQAAQIAVRQGRLKDAAEMFEMAGSRRRAADLYKQVGMTLKAEELLVEEQRAAKEREEQKAALHQRLQQSPEDEQDIASLDRTPPPSPKIRSSTPSPGKPATPAPAPAKSDLRDIEASGSTPELNRGADANPATPSLLGLRALMDETAPKAASQPLALAATQASLVSPAAPAARLLVPDGVEQEDPALRHLAGTTVHDDAKAAVEPKGVGDAQPPVEELSFAQAKPDKEQLLTDSDPSLQAVASSPPAIVEGLPERETRLARPTPRSPIPAVGPSIGAYRMVRPSEPEILTPRPQVRTPAPQRPGSPAGELVSGERRQPTPRPRLSLAAKPFTGEPPLPRSRTPSAETRLPDGRMPKMPSPGAGTGSKGTIE